MKFFGSEEMKVELGAKNCLYPLPTTIIGATVNHKPNYIAIAHVGIMDPDSISLGINKSHYTNEGIKENKTFSVNIPSTKLVKETDYCGLVSGKNTDKTNLFKTFYGKLKTAPMIEECPLNMECELINIVDFPKHDVFIGKVVETYCNDECLTDGIVDYSKVQPILFIMNDLGYWRIGERFARAWDIGNKINLDTI
jgi:flavin reductase (DIM6/NTAB) family NADH-FMN oxidoreductase RutF